MSWRGEKLHAFVRGLGQPKDSQIALELFDRTERLFVRHHLLTPSERDEHIFSLCDYLVETFPPIADTFEAQHRFDLVKAIFNYENLFVLPEIDWSERRQTSDWWALRDEIAVQLKLVEDFDATMDQIATTLLNFFGPIAEQLPALEQVDPEPGAIRVETLRRDMVGELKQTVGDMLAAPLSDDCVERGLFANMRRRIERNAIVASGSDPDDPKSRRTIVVPEKSDIKDRAELIATYLGGTPLTRFFDGTCDFGIPTRTRFEHHHIIAGTGHGKSQTLQYLIAQDLTAVETGEASVIVIDSQGDLIKTIANLKVFAPGEPLHERIVLIDPTDVEYPVSLNMFDIGLERLASYPMLERERLTNSILELYDFVLGSLLDAGMTQKQNVIFRYVTRLMLHIPNATIHTLRELMEPNGAVKYAGAIAKLEGSARHFFETEFNSKEFAQTKSQVLRRLWGILENQTFERMFSHPKSKLDLFSEMNAGKIILINTAKDLLKENGTQIFGRFFIALITQAAQERATLPGNKRLPTFVYVDEAADYFDQNIGIILSQARKFNVGMVLAHQYLGQLTPTLQDAFAANTSIKFAGGVSNKDARTLASMMGCELGFIESQKKGSFATAVRSLTNGAVSLTFPFGFVEDMEQQSPAEHQQLVDRMRSRYAVHYSQLKVEASGTDVDDAMAEGQGSNSMDGGHSRGGNTRGGATVGSGRRSAGAKLSGKPPDPDAPDIGAGEEW